MLNSATTGAWKDLALPWGPWARDQFVAERLVVDLDAAVPGEQRARHQEVVEHLRPAVVDDREAPRVRQGALHRHQGARRQLRVAGVLLVAADGADRHLVDVGVEVAADGDQRVGIESSNS